MFQTEDFIQEVEKKDCLWNRNDPDYNNSQARRAAWEEIGQVIYQNWNTAKYFEKDEKVLEMTKKWRNIRDYYNKEKKRQEKEQSNPRGHKFTKKRVYSYFQHLAFLDQQNYGPSQTTIASDDESFTSGNDAAEHQEHQEEVEEEEVIGIKVESGSQKRSLPKPITPTAKRPCTTTRRTQENESHSIATKNFLLSLIPDVETLNEQQYMNFRLGVLNLLNTIKFGNASCSNESWLISTIDPQEN